MSNISDIINYSAERAQQAQGESLSTFVASLTTSSTALGLGLLLYLFLRSRFPDYYNPQIRGACNLAWKPLPPPTQGLPLQQISNLDNYFFERYLYTLSRIFILLSIVVLPTITPLNVISGGEAKGLDRLSFSNVNTSHTHRYWAHFGVAVFVTVVVCYILRSELTLYAGIQRNWIAGQRGRSLLLISSVGKITSYDIRRHFDRIAGGIRVITMIRDYNNLRAKLRRREMILTQLEIAETTLIKQANCTKNANYTRDVESLPLWRRYVDPKDRPSIRLSSLPPPFPGSHVDAIYHFRSELASLNTEIEWDQRHPSTFPLTNSAFVRFNENIPAQLTALALRARIPPSWTLKHQTMPEDIIWQNVSITWLSRFIRTSVAYLLVTTLTVGFTFPVTMIGTLSQINYLSNNLNWLRWLEKLPIWLIAMIQGVLPPVLLAAITAAVPFVIRLLANSQGLHSRQDIESDAQVYYFVFLFVQGILNISLSAGFATIIGKPKDTIQSLPTLIAQNLPKACNYFFSYILIYTFTAVVFILVRFNGLLNRFIISPLLDKTPRQKWSREKAQDIQKWGTFVPVFTNIACIGLVYSVIAPLILAFSTTCFGSLYILYRIFPPKLHESGFVTTGRFYPTAIRQLLVGIYVMEVCLAGLFFLVRDDNGMATCNPQAILMLLTLTLTALFNYCIIGKERTTCLGLKSTRPPNLSHGRSREWLGARSDPGKSPADQPCVIRDEALVRPCPVLWIPQDNLGVAASEVDEIRRGGGISISYEGAFLNEQGRLQLQAPPP